MATFTPNLNLKKPDNEDFVDISDINNNMELIDGKISKMTALSATEPADPEPGDVWWEVLE